MTNGGRGDDAGHRGHRRPNPDELTPDDLFRPEPPGAAPYQEPAGQQYQEPPGQQYQQFPQQPPYQAQQPDPYQGQQAAPYAEPYQQASYPQPQQPPAQPGSENQWAEPWQGQSWSDPQAAAPASGAADETQVIQFPPGGGPAEGAPYGAPGDNAMEETRQIPQLPQSFPPVPPVPGSPPGAPPQTPRTGGQHRAHARQGGVARVDNAGGVPPAGPPFAIRPGLPSGAYGEEPSYVTPEDDASGAEETRVLPAVVADPPPPAFAPEASHGAQPGYPPAPPEQQPDLFRPDGPPHPAAPPQQPRDTPAAAAPAPWNNQGQQSQPGHQGQPGWNQQAPAGPPPAARSRRAGTGGSRRRLTPAAIAGIVVGCCAVIGLIAAAAFSGGGGDDKSTGDSQNASSSSDAPSSGSTTDPVKEQAKDLDKLLKDSNNSRSEVIDAVNDIRGCDNLGDAAETLRGAAGKRNDLVSRLAGLDLDKLPDHAKLTASLNKAWASSASADNHYASWADQVAGKKGCHKGQARVTEERRVGDRESGDATAAKKDAAGMWNSLASKYGLTQHDSTQL